MEGKAKAEYAKCVDISTQAAIREMVLPGLLAVLVPIIVGFYDVQALAGVLAGVTTSGVMLAIFMSNAGGAWTMRRSTSRAVRTAEGIGGPQGRRRR